MHHILDRLYLGDLSDGEKATAPLTCLLNLSQTAYDSPIRTIHAPIADEVFLPCYEWQALVHVLMQQLAHKQTVLVHCRLGKSRSPALVAAYLAACGHSTDVAMALAFVQSKRPIADPHPETLRGVMAWWEGR